jgi:hypothetical protein
VKQEPPDHAPAWHKHWTARTGALTEVGRWPRHHTATVRGAVRDHIGTGSGNDWMLTGQGDQVIVRSRTAALAVITSVAVLVAVTPGTAVADAVSFQDKRFDTRHPADILAVQVKHAEDIVVVVQHRDLTFTDSPGSIRVSYDTDNRSPGPEFWLRIAYQSDQTPQLRTTRGWARPATTPIPTCLGERVSVSASRDTTRVSVPRSCYGNPRSIRVHVRLDPRASDKRAADVAPRSRTMGPAVRHQATSGT